MTKPVYYPQLGELTLDMGPDNQWIWSGKVSIEHDDPVHFHIIINQHGDINKADINFITSVIQQPSVYILSSLHFIHKQLAIDPVSLGLDQKLAEKYLLLQAEDLPVSLPELDFYEDDEWHLRFNEGDFPICDPYGIIVVFKKQLPNRIENISDSDILP